MNIIIHKATEIQDIHQCLKIRKQVFIEEQKVSIFEDLDGLDDKSEHYLCSANHSRIGTARVQYLEHKVKIERVAILKPYRGRGFGKQLMKYIIQELKHSEKCNLIVLSAQTYVIPFYENLGFLICSPEYMDAGIPHKEMQLTLKNKMNK